MDTPKALCMGGDQVGGVPLPSRLQGLEERRELPQPGPGRSRKRIFSTVWVSQNALGEKKMQYFCLIW